LSDDGRDRARLPWQCCRTSARRASCRALPSHHNRQQRPGARRRPNDPGARTTSSVTIVGGRRWRDMRRLRLVPIVVLATAVVPAVASADAPWSSPASLSGGFGYDAPVIYTPHGNGVVAAAKSGSSSSAASVVATLHSDGTPGMSRT